VDSDVLSRLLSAWLRSRQILRPAQNRSKLSWPDAGVTFLTDIPFTNSVVDPHCFFASLNPTFEAKADRERVDDQNKDIFSAEKKSIFGLFYKNYNI
jgi:hypothetical protein